MDQNFFLQFHTLVRELKEQIEGGSINNKCIIEYNCVDEAKWNGIFYIRAGQLDCWKPAKNTNNQTQLFGYVQNGVEG